MIVHERNRGYGGNQKTCYAAALGRGADVVVMIHPDYQYSPLLVTALASMVAYGVYELALGSRILVGGARKGGMPLYKYIANRSLTTFQNLLTGARLSEYHTGYRAFDRRLLEALPLAENSEDFVFDNQMLAQAIVYGARIGEVSCPTRYFPEASSINLRRSIVYGMGVLKTSLQCCFARLGIYRARIFRFPARHAAPGIRPRRCWKTADEPAARAAAFALLPAAGFACPPLADAAGFQFLGGRDGHRLRGALRRASIPRSPWPRRCPHPSTTFCRGPPKSCWGSPKRSTACLRCCSWGWPCGRWRGWPPA